MLGKIRQLFRKKNGTDTKDKATESSASATEKRTGKNKGYVKQEAAAEYAGDAFAGSSGDFNSGNCQEKKRNKGLFKRAMGTLRRVPPQAAAACLALAAVVCLSLGIAGTVADASQASGYNSSQYFYLEYHANGGSGSMTTDKVYAGSKYTLKDCTFSYTGHYFTGWSYYYHSKYLYEDSSGDGDNGFYSTTTIPSGYTKITNLAWINYDSLPMKRGEETIYNKTSTAYAIANWDTESYKFRFDRNGGSGGFITGTVVYGSKYINSTRENINVPTKEGYTFTGYYISETDGNGTGIKVFNADGSKNTSVTTYWNSKGYWCKDVGDDGDTLTLHAGWVANESNVYLKYYKDGNTSASTFQTYIMTYDESSFVLSTNQTSYIKSVSSSVSKTGYDFAGWYTADGDNGTQVFNSKGVKVSSDGYWETTSSSGSTLVWENADSSVTLWAHWTPHTSYIEFDGNGGTGSMKKLTCSYGTATTLTANSFTRTGYTFVGWNAYYNGKYYYSNGTNDGWYTEGNQPSGWKKVMYANGASYTPLLSGSGVTVTMKAVWRNSNAAWDMSNILEDYYMFYGDVDITGGDADDPTTYDSLHTNSAYAQIDGGKNTNPGYFSEK